MATDDAVQKSEVDEADGGTIPKHGTSGLLVLANRLPVRRVTSPEGTHWETSPGGLVTALSPVLSQRSDAMWLGWSGTTGTDEEEPLVVDGLALAPVPLSRGEVELLYLSLIHI